MASRGNYILCLRHKQPHYYRPYIIFPRERVLWQSSGSNAKTTHIDLKRQLTMNQCIEGLSAADINVTRHTRSTTREHSESANLHQGQNFTGDSFSRRGHIVSWFDLEACFKVIENGTIRQNTYDFLLVSYSNFGRNSYRFCSTVDFCIFICLFCVQSVFLCHRVYEIKLYITTRTEFGFKKIKYFVPVTSGTLVALLSAKTNHASYPCSTRCTQIYHQQLRRRSHR